MSSLNRNNQHVHIPNPDSPTQRKTLKESHSSDFDLDSTLWTNCAVDSWSDSITGDDSIFTNLYGATNDKLLRAIKTQGMCFYKILDDESVK